MYDGWREEKVLRSRVSVIVMAIFIAFDGWLWQKTVCFHVLSKVQIVRGGVRKVRAVAPT